ncbi:MAG: DUF177 domain-containing protein [Candidatus Accumulibacter sp.]|jgi:uncharacterized protein|nr:DUF177 domain-containing protein [Accumulibacter sp.]
MPQRIVIDAQAFARDSRSLNGELPVVCLDRAHDWLADTAGALKYHIEGGMSDHGKPMLRLEIEGVLSVRCQRCLEGIRYPLNVRNVLECVDGEYALTREELGNGSRDFLPVWSEIDVVALIEDEVILQLPIAPRHEDCVLPRAGRDAAERVSPFAVLESLKNGKAR